MCTVKLNSQSANIFSKDELLQLLESSESIWQLHWCFWWWKNWLVLDSVMSGDDSTIQPG